MIKTRVGLGDDKGMAMVIVIVVIMMLAMIGSYITSLRFNQRIIVDGASGHRAQAYYSAQAGAVDANFRIRTDFTTGLVPAGSFATAAYDPNPYTIDIDGDGASDVTVNIGPVNGAGLRQIDCTGTD